MITISEDSQKSFSEMANWTCKLFLDSEISKVLKRDQRLFSTLYAIMFPYSPTLKPKDEYTPSKEVRDELREITKGIAIISGGYSEFNSSFHRDFYHGYMLYEQFTQTDDFSKWTEWLKQVERVTYDVYTKNAKVSSTSIDLSTSYISDILSLSESEEKLLKFQVYRSYNAVYTLLYEHLFAYSKMANAQWINYCVFKLTNNLIPSKTSNLFKSGLVKYNESNHTIPVMMGNIVNLFCVATDEKEFLSLLTTKMKTKKSASGAMGSMIEKDKKIMMSLLCEASYDDVGINVLVYGSKNLDKKTSVRQLLAGSEYNIPDEKIYALTSLDIPRAALPIRAYLAQRIIADLVEQEIEDIEDKSNDTSNYQFPILIVEHAQDVLSKTSSFFNFFGGFAKREENEEDVLELDELLLDENPIPTIWLTDNPDSLVEENVGRFLFHSKLKPASRAERRNQIDKEVEDIGLDDEFKTYLSKYNELNPRQVRSAVKCYEIIGEHEYDKRTIISQSVLNSQKALGRESMEELRESITSYSLEYLNLSGSFTPDQIINALKRSQKGTIALYGIPGSGKTALAEYIAMKLDKPLIKKKASDLLSKWVGDNEQNISTMFREATEDDAILFLDEADSFLRDRTQARAQWEATMVNEMLVQIEQYKGIFIAATNLFREIDQAALRRFTFKLEFKALTEAQREKMFFNESPILTEFPTEDERAPFIRELHKIKHLAPGDFATVKRQTDIIGNQFSTKEWLEQLASESQDKLYGIEKSQIGFRKDD